MTESQQSLTNRVPRENGHTVRNRRWKGARGRFVMLFDFLLFFLLTVPSVVHVFLRSAAYRECQSFFYCGRFCVVCVEIRAEAVYRYPGITLCEK